MSDVFFAQVLTMLAESLWSVAADLIKDFLRRRGAGDAAGDVDSAQLGKAIQRAQRALTGLSQGELSHVDESEWSAAVMAVRDSLAVGRHVDLALAFEAGLDAQRLAQLIETRARPVLAAAALSEAGEVAYRRTLAIVCEQLLAYFRSLPQFQELLQTHTFWQVGDVARQLDQLLQEPDRRFAQEDQQFAVRYAEQVADVLGRFELFGVTRSRRPRLHTFDKWVALAVARRTRGELDDDEDGLTGVGIDVANAVVDHPRVIVRAGAGAGKTTLLQWLAAKVADRAVWTYGGFVPFFVPLRQFVTEELPAPDMLPLTVARMIGGEMPPGWASRQLASGRALLVVDGVDELPADRRDAARQWLRELVRAYPHARYVVTSRPAAIDEDWLSDEGFVPFDLLTLSAHGVRQFVTCWHDAAREEYGAEPGAAQWLATCEQELTELLGGRPELRRLAASPLLAGLICALYQDRHMHLPRDRKSLYDAALELLLLRWDERRGVRWDRDPLLSIEEQTVVLQRLAYSLVKNQDLLLDRQEAVRRITHAMRGLRPHHVDPQVVLQRTLERTGLLREVYPGQIQFVHRTFRDYLAAKEAVDSGDLGLLIDHAHLDQWHDVVIMAVAHARPRERERILRDLLVGNAAAQRDPAIRDRLRLVAAACLEQADVMDTDEIRQQVHQAARRLIPPRSLHDAELLAKAGSFVLELLPGPEGLSEEEAARVVRTAAMIGGEGAREAITRFALIDQTVVIDELLRAWRLSDDPENYARTVLADVDFGDRRLDIQRWSRVQYLRHLTSLTTVSCRGDLSPLDPLAAIPRLRHLELLQNTVLRDLAPLRQCRTLRVLHLASCPMVRDLSPLARSTVTELRLHLMTARLDTLGGSRIEKLTVRDRRLAADLDALPIDLPLVELTLDNRPPDRSLRGIERWPTLACIAVFGTPDRQDVASLAALPALTRLAVHQPDTAAGLAELAGLPALRELAVDDLPVADRTGILATLHELSRPGRLTVTVDGRPLPD